MKVISILIYYLLFPCLILAQNLPVEMRITSDGRLIHGGNTTSGLYQTDIVNKFEIILDDPDWFNLMDGTYVSGNYGEMLIGKLIFNDTLILDSVLVGIKGYTSDINNLSEKKSFKIEIDKYLHQDLLGYDNLNLNSAFEDPSCMREVLYYDISKNFAPALKGCFVDLYINGQYWGPYSNIQQLEGKYIKEWFVGNKGTRWRAVSPILPHAIGAGVSSLNYNGPDSSDYNTRYTLKSSHKENPWDNLINLCYQLNNIPSSDLYEELKYSLDIDRTLWFLAQEIIFADNDSYVHKGGMDYYIYWDQVTNRVIPLEVDGNTVLLNSNINWSPFYHEADERFPLLNKLLKNTEIRQRYLAHLRTIIEHYFVEQNINERIDEFSSLLNQRIKNDPKKIITYNEYLNGVNDLKNAVSYRSLFLKNHNEMNRNGIEIYDLNINSITGATGSPLPEEEVNITVKINGDAQRVMLYYGLGLDGDFERIQMYDDGLHGDQSATDKIYGASIPGFLSGSFVRYYIEGIKNDEFSTAVYYPEGAEHDVFIYQIEQENNIVINEFMADNKNCTQDLAGEYDDWIELYNNGTQTYNLTGHYLSDNESHLTKWKFPDGTTIHPDSYLIIWADEDLNQSDSNELHANFKLSSKGESLIIANNQLQVIDSVVFSAQSSNKSYSRIPNGIGAFKVSEPTLSINNDSTITGIESNLNSLSISIFPNPSSNYFSINFGSNVSKPLNVNFYNISGLNVYNAITYSNSKIDVSSLENGMYILVINDTQSNIFYHEKVLIFK